MARTNTTGHWTGWTGQSRDANAKRNAADMFKRLGFDNEAAKKMVEEGLIDVEHMELFTDDDWKQLISSMRKPGGGGEGVKVPMVPTMMLPLLSFGIRLHTRIDRSVDTTDISNAWCQKFRFQRDMELQAQLDTKGPNKADYPKVTTEDGPRFIESVPTFLDMFRGSSGIPLGYVLRNHILCKDEDNGPGFGQPDTIYSSWDHEMTVRAPIIPYLSRNEEEEELEKHGPFTPQFAQDNALAWDFCYPWMHKSSIWSHVKQYKRSQDMRKAFMALKKLFLGDDSIATQAAALETKLTNLTYNGDGPNFTFRHYRTKHKECHLLADSLAQHGYHGIDAASRVRYFLAGIKAPAMEVPKATIQSRNDLKNDFDQAATVCQDFINVTPALQHKKRNVSAVSGGKGGGGRGNGKRGGGGPPSQREIEAQMPEMDRRFFRGGQKGYVQTPEYRRLTHAQRLAIKQLRKEKGLDGGSGMMPPRLLPRNARLPP